MEIEHHHQNFGSARRLLVGLSVALTACGFAGLAQAQVCMSVNATTGTTSGPCTGSLAANGAGTLTGTGVQVTTTTDNTKAVYSSNNSTVTINGTGNTVTTSGLNDDGLTADAGGTLAANNIVVTVSGDGSQGVWVNYTSTVTLTNATVTAEGSAATASYGIRMYGWDFDYGVPPPTAADLAVFNGNNVTVNAVTWGAVVGGGATLTLTNGSSLNSSTRGGLYISDDGTENTANLTNSSVTTTATSPTYEAVHIELGGILNATNSTLTGTADAILSADGTTATPNVINITGGTLNAAAGDAIGSTGTVDDITLAGAITVNASTGNLLNVDATSTDNVVAASGAKFTGNIQTASGGTSNVTLNAGSVWTITGAGSTITNLTGPGAVTINETAAAANPDLLTITGTVSDTPTLNVVSLSSYLTRSGETVADQIPLVAGATASEFKMGTVSGGTSGYIYSLTDCTGTGYTGDVCLIATAAPISSSAAIPTLNPTALALLALLLAGVGFAGMRRKN